MTAIFRFSRRCVLVYLGAMALSAGDTRTWTQGEYADYQKGIVKNLAIRSDGLVTLAPRNHEIYDTSLPYLWAVARDSKGNLYAGGGTSAKLFRIPPDGKGKLLAEFDGIAVQAIAIDSRDRVYAATSPDGKIYRITGNGKPEVFFDPKAKYIWAMAFDATGNLYVATGDSGEIFRVPQDGKGQSFFKTGEAHVRCMTFDSAGNLIVGTEPGGLVLRVSPTATGFVLYQMSKREVTAVAVASDGAIFAAAVGNKQVAPAPTPQQQVTPQIATITVGPPGAQGPAQPRPTPTPPPSTVPAGVTGGSDVYRIRPDGNPERVWTNNQDVVYAIGFDAGGHAILGTGNRGYLYRIEAPSSYTSLMTVPATQVTALLPGAAGRLYAVTGNVGRLFEIGPELEQQGTLESDVLDAGMYSLWGRLSFEANLNGGKIGIQTRSGNLDEPQKDWSSWSGPVSTAKGGPIASPAARFIQWKATLTAASGGTSPQLESVSAAWLPKNVAPRIDQIEITQVNYKFPAPSAPTPAGQPQSLNLPPLGRVAPSLPTFATDAPPSTNSPSMQWAKGALGARWVSYDPNGDSLLYRVDIRGAGENEWKLLKDKVAEKYFSFDATAFPDGEYRLRITASDSPSNPPADALTAELVSDPFTIDNTPPRVTGLTASRNGAKLEVRWHAADALNVVTKAEYSLDGADWIVASPVNKLSDSMDLDYNLLLDAGPGEHTIAVRVQDDAANQATEKTVIK